MYKISAKFDLNMIGQFDANNKIVKIQKSHD